MNQKPSVLRPPLRREWLTMFSTQSVTSDVTQQSMQSMNTATHQKALQHAYSFMQRACSPPYTPWANEKVKPIQ